MTLQDEIRQMVIAARLYYENNRTQAEIAQDLGISRPTVSRLLQHAIEEGIVQIQISDPFANNEELAAGLCSATGLEKAIVVPGESTNTEIVRHRIALAAARFLGETLTSNDIIGIGWGRTLYEVSQVIEPKPITGLLAVPLLGGLGQVDHRFQVHDITRRISNAFSGSWQQFYFPGIVRDKEVLKSISDSADMERVVSIWKRMTIALVGLANIDFDSEMKLLFTDYLEDPDRYRLAKEGAVGDIARRFFDIKGRPVAYQTQAVISIELEQLRLTPRVIAVAGGKDKASAILGAINGHYIKILITDELTAGEIITLSKNQPA